MSLILKLISFVSRVTRDAWLIVGIVIVLIMVLEGSARLLFYAKDIWMGPPALGWCEQVMDADSYRDASWPKEYCNQHNSVAMEWHPYVYWRRQPIEGKYINVDRRGYRFTLNRPALSSGCNAKPVRIFVLGGSTIWGPGVRDNYTIPSHLSNLLFEADLCVEILNLGEQGYVSTQELILLQRHLQRGDIPDLVIFYDGVNESFSAYQNNEAGIPQNEDNRREEFNYLLDHKRVRGAYLAQLARPEGLSRLSDGILKRLKANQSGGKVGEQRLQSTVMNQVLNENELISDTLAAYKSNIEMIQLLASHYSFDALFYWQPMIFTKQTLSSYEKRWYEFASEQWKDFLLAAYKRVEEDVPLNQLPQFHNISSVFDQLDDPFYLDAFHLTEDGNLVVAREIGKDIIGILGPPDR